MDGLIAVQRRSLNDSSNLLLQELIIQNFVPKKNTAMAHAAEPPFEEMLWTIALTRLLFGPSMNIQAPPNLTPGKLITPITLHQLVLDR